MQATVADTTPLNYLVLIQAADILPNLYRTVLILPAVKAELARLRRHPTILSVPSLGQARCGWPRTRERFLFLTMTAVFLLRAASARRARSPRWQGRHTSPSSLVRESKPVTDG